jgi:hypothetical protein
MARQKTILNKDNKKLILYAVAGGAAYFLILKPILVKLGIVKSAAELAQERINAGNIDTYIDDAIRLQTPTKSVGEWTIIANNIYESLRYSGLSDDKNNAVYQLARAKNDADIATIYKAFGKRQEYLFGVPYGGLQDLVNFVKSNLSSDQLNTVNDNYRRKNIKFRF